MNKTILALAAAVGLQAAALSANAAVIGFESLYHDDDQVADAGYQFVEAGFQFDNLGLFPFATYGAQIPEYTGSTALINDNDDGVTIMTRVDGGNFTLLSVDLSELFLGDMNYSVTFTGLTSLGDAVAQTFTLDGLAGAQTFNFDSSFNHLSSVSWTNTAAYHQFDNVEVPEPASLALVGLGMVAAVGRRRKQAA